jgi:hypothetical protein
MVEYGKYIEQLKGYRSRADFAGLSANIDAKLEGDILSHSFWFKPVLAGAVTAFLFILIFNVYGSNFQKRDLLADYVFEGTESSSSISQLFFAGR